MADSLEDVCDRILGGRPQDAPHGNLDASMLLDFESVEREAQTGGNLIGDLNEMRMRIQPARLTINVPPTGDISLTTDALPRGELMRRRPVLRSVTAADCNSLAQFSIGNPAMRALMNTRNEGPSRSKAHTEVSFALHQAAYPHSPHVTSSQQQVIGATTALSDELKAELAEQRKLLLQLHRHQTAGAPVPSMVLDTQRKAIMSALDRCATEDDVKLLEKRLHSVNRHYDSQLGSASAALVEANAALRTERMRMEEERRQWRRERTVLAVEASRHAAERLRVVEDQAALRTAEVASRSMRLVAGLEKDREEIQKLRYRQHTPQLTEIKGGIILPIQGDALQQPSVYASRARRSQPIVDSGRPVEAAPSAESQRAEEAASMIYNEDVARHPTRAAPKSRLGSKVGPRPKPAARAGPGGAPPTLLQSEHLYGGGIKAKNDTLTKSEPKTAPAPFEPTAVVPTNVVAADSPLKAVSTPTKTVANTNPAARATPAVFNDELLVNNTPYLRDRVAARE